ncbi:hypothetical protein QBC44DRAFT_383181 [Cladorrhinum sp. PSN332]|nr:hypothetical protein QBC44DRAFT_383181 [Cladorrhinum sp. PSN332]
MLTMATPGKGVEQRLPEIKEEDRAVKFPPRFSSDNDSPPPPPEEGPDALDHPPRFSSDNDSLPPPPPLRFSSSRGSIAREDGPAPLKPELQRQGTTLREGGHVTPDEGRRFSSGSIIRNNRPAPANKEDARAVPQTTTADLDLNKPDEWIWDRYGKDLVGEVKPWVLSDSHGKKGFEVSLAQAQRVYLLRLRVKLAKHMADWEQQGAKFKVDGDWADDLHRYVQGLQDYDYMDKFSRGSDPFHLTAEFQLDRTILDAAFAAGREGRRKRQVRKWEQHPGPIVPSRSDNRFRRLSSRIVVSLIGAGFLIGPMWLMMLKTGTNVALISTSAFVVVFGIMMASVLDEHIHVLSSTAAYAAVLVVFVGLRG